MTPMTSGEIKKQLRQYRMICNECEHLQKRIEAKRADMNYLKAVVSNGTIRSSGVSDTVERAIELMDGLINRYALKTVACEEAEARVLDMIELVSEGLGRSILFLHYIEGKRFADIPDMLHIADKTMWRRYNEAIEKLTVNDSK